MAAGLPAIGKEELTFAEELGSGSFGAVWRAKWQPPGDKEALDVAVKRVLLLQKEAAVLNSLRHRNIVHFYGVCHAKPDFYIVTEYAPGGSLKKYLANRKNTDLEFEHMLRWAMDIILGVRYLHVEAPTPLLHRDLKSDNVVISASDVCKLCDFGTAKPAGVPNTSVAGTVPWMSPEMILNKEVAEPTDIYSYGVILWEMVTREVPFKGMNEFMVSMMVVEKDVRLVIPSNCPGRLEDLMTRCWAKDPTERPDSREVLIAVAAMKGDRRLEAEACRFFAEKAEWLSEIQDQAVQLQEREAELDLKELELHRRLRHQFARSAVHNRPRYDLLLWDEEDVAAWLRSLEDVAPEEAKPLADLLRTHRINGERLLMLSASDLDRLSVPLGTQLAILAARDSLNAERLRLANFPPLLDTAPEANSARRKPASRPITLTLLTGIYYRQVITRNSSGPHERWKPFVDLDIDDLDEFEHCGKDPASLLRDVTFCFTNPHPKDPYRVPGGAGARLPLSPPEWMIGVMGAEEVTVVVNYAESVVLRPRNTRFTVHASKVGAGKCKAKQVDLSIRLVSSGSTPSSASVHPASPPDNIWEARSSSRLFPPNLSAPVLLKPPGVNSLQSTPSRSSTTPTIQTQGIRAVARQTRCVLSGSKTTSAGEMQESPMWSQIAEGLRQNPLASEPQLRPYSFSPRSALKSPIKMELNGLNGETRGVTFGVGDSTLSDEQESQIIASPEIENQVLWS